LKFYNPKFVKRNAEITFNEGQFQIYTFYGSALKKREVETETALMIWLLLTPSHGIWQLYSKLYQRTLLSFTIWTQVM